MRSVEHAAELAGGYDALAERLCARAEDVLAWSAGRAMPDAAMLFLVLDVILSETKKLSATVEALAIAQHAVRKAQRSSKAA